MRRSPYFRLDDDDVMVDGDEIRFDTPLSFLTQQADEGNDEGRRGWVSVAKVWVGKTFGEFRRGLPNQKIDCRRKEEIFFRGGA